MSRGVQWSLFGAAVVAALIALAGCSHYLFAEREPWRRDAEIACLNSGAVKESPERVRISAISGRAFAAPIFRCGCRRWVTVRHSVTMTNRCVRPAPSPTGPCRSNGR